MGLGCIFEAACKKLVLLFHKNILFSDNKKVIRPKKIIVVLFSSEISVNLGLYYFFLKSTQK